MTARSSRPWMLFLSIRSETVSTDPRFSEEMRKAGVPRYLKTNSSLVIVPPSKALITSRREASNKSKVVMVVFVVSVCNMRYMGNV